MGPDKAAVERWFRTVREGFLAALPGYKGPDVYTRGERPETDCFFFVHELEACLRHWVATVYHRRPHEGLIEAQVPGVELSPLDMFELGVTRAGVLRIRRRPTWSTTSCRWSGDHPALRGGDVRVALRRRRHQRLP